MGWQKKQILRDILIGSASVIVCVGISFLLVSSWLPGLPIGVLLGLVLQLIFRYRSTKKSQRSE